jgi:hypothetical protein
MKTLKTKSDVLSKQVQEIVQLAARDKQAAAEKADAVFAQEGADFYREYAKRFGLAALAEYDKQRVTGLTKAFDLKTAQENKEREYIQKDKELALRREQIESQERLRKAQMQASEEMKKMMFGLKQQDKVLPLSQGVRGVESLLTQLQDPEVRTGLLAKTAPIFEKFKSVVDDKEEFESAVNKALPPELTATDKTTLFLKNALLESYAIERAAAGGVRAVILGGAGLLGFAKTLQPNFEIPIIDSVQAGFDIFLEGRMPLAKQAHNAFQTSWVNLPSTMSLSA